MIPRLVPALLLSIAAAALQASPQTYKWVDAKGVVNYSNTRPPESAARIQPVEQRLSVIGADPSFVHAAAALREREARRAQYEEREWLQRQSAMLTQQQSSASVYCAFGPDCGLSYYPEIYYPYYAYPAYAYRVGGGRPIKRPPPHPAPHVRAGGGFNPRGAVMQAGWRGGGYNARGAGHGGRSSPR